MPKSCCESRRRGPRKNSRSTARRGLGSVFQEAQRDAGRRRVRSAAGPWPPPAGEPIVGGDGSLQNLDEGNGELRTAPHLQSRRAGSVGQPAHVSQGRTRRQDVV